MAAIPAQPQQRSTQTEYTEDVHVTVAGDLDHRQRMPGIEQDAPACLRAAPEPAPEHEDEQQVAGDEGRLHGCHTGGQTHHGVEEPLGYGRIDGDQFRMVDL